MLKKLHSILIEPHSHNRDARSREIVLNYVLSGILLLTITEFITSSFGFLMLRQHYIIYRLIGIFAAIFIFGGLYWLARKRQKQKLISFIIIGILFSLGLLVAAKWGTVTPTGVLLFGFIITLSGILLGSRYAIYLAVLTSVSLAVLEYFKAQGIVVPDQTWMHRQSSISDIFGFATIYAVIALVSWLFNRQMEQSLERAQQSEAALERQNDLLEQKVKQRTRQLEAAQLEKLQQIYRFAELGRISSALFHDLANHLSSVSLSIEDLNSRQQSGLMQRVQHDISYIDEVVQRVRLQLRGQGSVERLNVAREVRKVADILNYKMVQYSITLTIEEPSRPVMLTTDLIPFRQIISNLLSNAIDAYQPTLKKRRKIIVTIGKSKDTITLSFTDWGVGVSKNMGSRIFEPFYSNKTDGTGIGLFIVKQIVESDLGGSITLTSDSIQGTIFSIDLPRNYEKKRS